MVSRRSRNSSKGMACSTRKKGMACSKRTKGMAWSKRKTATNRPDAAVAFPPLWHWLYFLPTAPRRSIGPDGHMVNQEWVDSTLRRRRLFAAARTEFIRPLQIGLRAQMKERVLGRRDKQGKSGPFQILT